MVAAVRVRAFVTASTVRYKSPSFTSEQQGTAAPLLLLPTLFYSQAQRRRCLINNRRCTAKQPYPPIPLSTSAEMQEEGEQRDDGNDTRHSVNRLADPTLVDSPEHANSIHPTVASPSVAPRSRTGLFIRARALRALEAASASLNSGQELSNAPASSANASVAAAEGQHSNARQLPLLSVTDILPASDVASSSSASSTTSHDSAYTQTSSTVSLGRHLRNKSASFITGLTAASSTGTGSTESSPISNRSQDSLGRRARLNETLRLPRRQMSTYTPSYSSRGVHNDEYRKHNLFPLPAPSHVRPILLPAHAVLSSTSSKAAEQAEETSLRVRIDGFVEQWPDRVGTGQRIFMQLARQLANLPRLPRQQPSSSLGRSAQEQRQQQQQPTTSNTRFSTSAPTTPLHADTDDAVFFPEMPYGIPKHPPQHAEHHQNDEHDHEAYGGEKERPGDTLTRHALALGAPERTIGRVLQGIGALPVEGEGWTSQMIESMKHAQNDVDQTNDEAYANEAAAAAHSTSTAGTPSAGPLGGSPFWANRTREDVERLWRTLEHRLRCFWTYRKPFQQVFIEVIPVFKHNHAQCAWVTDEYDVSTDPRESTEDDPVPLLAVTDLTSDANGLFSTHLCVPHAKLHHYFARYHAHDEKSIDDIRALRLRARMVVQSDHVVQTPWQTVDVVHDVRNNVHIICDIDDTAKHTHVLGGARAVARNVFARPFEEVVVPGVTKWFEQLSSSSGGGGGEGDNETHTDAQAEPLISGWHYVTNAPAEMHAITKAYLSAAELPAGSLLLKHYFSSSRGSSSLAWLQGLMQPASTRKKNNLLRCLDDFQTSQFMLVGDSGEMDLDVYCELARMRPDQIKAIWIRDVGNVGPLAKALVDLRASKDVQTTAPQQQQQQQQQQQHSSDAGRSKKKVYGINKTSSASQSSSTDSSAVSDHANLSKDSSKTSAAHGNGTSGQHLSSSEMKSDAAGSSGNGNSAASEDFLVRLQRNLHTLPESVTLQIWETGYDAIAESVRQLKLIKGITTCEAKQGAQTEQ